MKHAHTPARRLFADITAPDDDGDEAYAWLNDAARGLDGDEYQRDAIASSHDQQDPSAVDAAGTFKG